MGNNHDPFVEYLFARGVVYAHKCLFSDLNVVSNLLVFFGCEIASSI